MKTRIETRLANRNRKQDARIERLQEEIRKIFTTADEAIRRDYLPELLLESLRRIRSIAYRAADKEFGR